MEPSTLKINEVEYVRKDSLPVPYTPGKNGPWEIGQPYYIATVTHHYHGVLVDVTDHELVLSGAAWIADDGRFSPFIKGNSDPREVEPFADEQIVIVGRPALICATIRTGSFRGQK